MANNKRLYYHSPQGDLRRAPRALRIVVVDDDRDSVLSLMMLLQDEGHDVRGLYSVERVTQVVQDFRPDVVILDIAMPDTSGWELGRQIRARFGRPPRLIAISGVYKLGADQVLAELSGFDHFLAKPYHLDALLNLLAPLSQSQ